MPGTDGLTLLSPAVLHRRPRLPWLGAGAPPFLATTVASEQQLGLDSRLKMEPRPRLLPTCKPRAQTPAATEHRAACPPAHAER